MRAALVVAGVFAVCAPAVAGYPRAAADPADGGTAYLVGACFDPGQPVTEKPATVVYGCDSSSVMVDMVWSSWGADGATGTGIDSAVQCRPNCAQGATLTNPIIVHAWNPLPATDVGCPADLAFYTDFTVAYPAGAPPWVVPGTSWTDGVDYVYLDGMPAVHFSGQHPEGCAPLGDRGPQG